MRGLRALGSGLVCSGCAVGANVHVPVMPAPPLSGVAAVLLGAGDIARCNRGGDERTGRLLDSLLRVELRRGREVAVFTAGDHAYERGTVEEFRRCFGGSWGAHPGIIAAIRPAIGNHDYGTQGAAPYFAYFGDRAGPAGRGYYSYDLAGWHVVALNSEVAASGGVVRDPAAAASQEAWLREDLARHAGAVCTVAYWHRPRFSSGGYQSDAALAVLWEILYRSGAEAVVSGHDHDYERFVAQDPDGVADTVRGVVQFVAGTGGGRRRNFRRPAAANSLVRVARKWGILKLELAGRAYRWEFVAVDGRVYDSGTAGCH